MIFGMKKKSHKKRKARLVCEICGISNGKGDKEITEHHKKPRSEGGSNRRWNIQRICLGCHKKIHNGKDE